MAEYEKLKEQRKASEVTMNTDDGFKFSNSDGSASIQFGTLQQFDLADYDEDKAKLSNGTDLRRSRVSIAGNFLTDWQYRVEYEFVGTAGITDAYVAYAKFKPWSAATRERPDSWCFIRRAPVRTGSPSMRACGSTP